MNAFQILTPVIYWLSVGLWTYILGFLLRRLRRKYFESSLLNVLIIILAINALRTLFESIYFGAWYTSKSGFLPISVYDFLVRPEIVIIPKMLNVITAVLIIGILLYRWFPAKKRDRELQNSVIKEYTRELRESEERFRLIFENAPVLINSFDEDGQCTLWNEQCRKTFGWTMDEINALNDSLALFYPDPSVRDEVRKAMTSDPDGHFREWNPVTKEGQTLTTVWANFRLPSGIVYGLGYDITERKKAEEKIKDLARFPEENTNPVIRISKEGFLLYANPASITILPASEMKTGMKMSSHWRTLSQQAFDAGQPTETEVVINKKTFSVTLAPVLERDYINIYAHDISASKQTEAELQKAHRLLESRVEERTAELKIRKDEAEMLNRAMINVLEDLKQSNLGLKAAKNSLRTTNKELESFSYSISHDLRAPLRHLTAFSELLQKNNQMNLDDKSRRHLSFISESAVRMGQLIDGLLTFSRAGRTDLHKIPLDLDALVKSVINSFSSDTQERQILWDIVSLPQVNADPVLLQAVLTNLFSNALKFTQPRDEVKIKMGYTESEKENVFFVRDNGVGFDMKYAEKLFGVFQRLHSMEQFEGTGIGLANVRRIIERHGGRTWAESVLNEGATFYFSLPKPTE